MAYYQLSWSDKSTYLARAAPSSACASREIRLRPGPVRLRVASRSISQAQEVFAATESVGQQRMTALHRGDRGSLEISPNLWAGYGLVRGGAGTALVGSHREVADRIEEYHTLGIDHFILSGQPHLEEAYYFAEGAAAELRSRGLLPAPPP